MKRSPLSPSMASPSSQSAAPIRFAIIGSGMIAEFHARAIAQTPGAQLAAVYSRSPEARSRFAAEHACRAADSLAELVADPRIHAVCITTPSGTHAECAIPFLETGRAVLCEKPLEISLPAVDSILAAEARGGGLLACVFQQRLGSAVQTLKHAIEAGRFGRLTLCSAYVKWWRPPSYYENSSWKGTWALDGGGALMNQGIHALDLLQWLAGMPETVSAFHATLAHPGVEAEDTLVAALRFPSGALGVIEAATSCWPGEDLRIEIRGDRGAATLQQDRITQWEFRDEDPAGEQLPPLANTAPLGSGASDPSAISTAGHCLLIQDLVRAIQEKRAPLIPGSEARKAVQLARAIYDSAKTGTLQSLPKASLTGSTAPFTPGKHAPSI